MQDSDKTKAELIEELEALRARVAELEQSEQKFRGLAESTRAHISVIQDDRFVYANQAFLEWNGLDADDLELISAEELMTMGDSSSALKAAAEPAWQAAVAQGQRHFRFEYPDGEGCWLETNVTLMELDGKESVLLMTFDITEHKRVLEALADSEKKFRALAESTTAEIMIIQDERFLYANKAALEHLGMTWEELSSHAPNDVLMDDNDDPESCEAYAREALLLGGGRFRRVYSETDADGAERWYEIHVAEVEIEGKTAFISTSFDITSLKRAQAEMYRADKMAALGQIIAGVAHEINNPNNFIYFNLPILRRYIDAMTPLLERQLEEQPNLKLLRMPYEAFMQDVYKLLENMEYGSQRITGIVADLKHYVRNDEEEKAKPEPVGKLIERVMTLVGKQVRKMVKSFEVEVADALPNLEVNAGKIEQVLINLVINAGQAADKDDSWVKLVARSAEAVEGWVELLVSDNGAGIPEENVELIFEPFFTSKGREQGTGLGLSISHRIIEDHGGRISVESEVGEGTTFTVLLPPSTSF